jgi:ribosomal protein S27AE
MSTVFEDATCPRCNNEAVIAEDNEKGAGLICPCGYTEGFYEALGSWDAMVYEELAHLKEVAGSEYAEWLGEALFNCPSPAQLSTMAADELWQYLEQGEIHENCPHP